MSDEAYCEYCGRQYARWRVDQRLCGRQECHDRFYLKERQAALAEYRARRATEQEERRSA